MYSVALERLQLFKADTDEAMHEGVSAILPLYSANAAKLMPKMLETMEKKSFFLGFESSSCG